MYIILSIFLQVSGIISLIDDDTLTPQSVEAFHRVCTDNNIVGTYACITSRGIFYPNLIDTLHAYEEDGFQVVLHCHEQKNFYRWNENLDMTVSGVQSITVGANYQYVVNGRTCPLSVEEVHLDSLGNGHIFFNYMQIYYPGPTSTSGVLQKSSGSGDTQISYSNYQVRPFRDDGMVAADMETAISLLQQNGFMNYAYFVSPYGSKDVGLQTLAQALGLKCLVSISNDDHMRNNNQYTPYFIPRIGFNASDAGYNTMDRLKEHIDSVAMYGGWLLVGTHIYNGWTNELKQTRFSEFVDYAKSRGLTFMTLKDGFEYYSSHSGNEHFSSTSNGSTTQNLITEHKYYTPLGLPAIGNEQGFLIRAASDGTTTKLYKHK